MLSPGHVNASRWILLSSLPGINPGPRRLGTRVTLSVIRLLAISEDKGMMSRGAAPCSPNPRFLIWCRSCTPEGGPTLIEHRLQADASATPSTGHANILQCDMRRGQCTSQSRAHPAPPQLGSGCPGCVLSWLESEPAGQVLCEPPDRGAACSLQRERQTHTRRRSLIL